MFRFFLALFCSFAFALQGPSLSRVRFTCNNHHGQRRWHHPRLRRRFRRQAAVQGVEAHRGSGSTAGCGGAGYGYNNGNGQITGVCCRAPHPVRIQACPGNCNRVRPRYRCPVDGLPRRSIRVSDKYRCDFHLPADYYPRRPASSLGKRGGRPGRF